MKNIGDKMWLVRASLDDGEHLSLHSTEITADCCALDYVNDGRRSAGMAVAKHHWRAALRELREEEPGVSVEVTPLRLNR